MRVHRLLSRLDLTEGPLPSFEGAVDWLNSDPLRPEDLEGKAVAVNFWTFTCINWIRTLPYLRSWHHAYRDRGLVIVGVHTPEFRVEHDINTVGRAVHSMGIEYAVAIDNDYAVWNAFSNQYWPARYLADATGELRHHHFGEGGYERSERVIRRLLTESGHGDLPSELAHPIEAHGLEAQADWHSLRSPETYVGAARAQRFASPERIAIDEPREYTKPSRLHLDQWALTGIWTLEREAAVSHSPNSGIAYQFHARDLHLILVPPTDAPSARFRVVLDGQTPGDAHGIDIDAHGNGTVTEPRLYQLIRQRGHITDRQLAIEFVDPGASALCFTFG